MGEGVFIGLESNSGHSAKGAYVRYYYTTVQGLSHTYRYYPAVNPKSSIRLVLLSVHLCTIHRV
jgi:hypothetical protein